MARHAISRPFAASGNARWREQVTALPIPKRSPRLRVEPLEPRLFLSASGDVVVNEIMQNPFQIADSFGEWSELFNATDRKIDINEIMQNPFAVPDAEGEWFEVFNVTNTAVDIDGWKIKDGGSDGHAIDNGGPLLVPAGGFLVLARDDDTNVNGGVSADYVYGNDIVLSHGSDELVLLNKAGIEIDRVEWDDGVTFPDPVGASMALFGPSLVCGDEPGNRSRRFPRLW